MNPWAAPEMLPNLLLIEEPAERLKAIGGGAIGSLMSHVSRKSLTDLVRNLPEIRGWNRGTERERGKQQTEIARSVTAGKPLDFDDPYVRAYGFIWAAAARERFGSAWSFTPTRESLLSESAAAEILTSTLSELSASNSEQASREAMSDLLVFSPIFISSEVRSQIQALPSAKDLAQRRLLLALPEKVDGLADDVARTCEMLASIDSKVSESSAISEAAFTELRATIAAEKVGSLSQEELQSTNSVVAKIESDVKEAQATIESVSADLQVLRGTATEIASLRTDLQSVQAALASLRASTEAIEHALTAPSPAAPSSQLIADVAASPPKSAIAQGLPSAPTYVTFATDGDRVVLDNWWRVYEHVRDALYSLGGPKTFSQWAGLSIAAALRAGQCPVLAGSAGEVIALELAMRVLGPNTLLVDIPIGSLQPIRNPSDIAPSCIVITGMARSPIEAIGGELRQDIIRRQLGSYRGSHIPTIGTFEASTTSLPLCRQLLEMGPMLDTDMIRWRTPKGAAADQESRFEISGALLQFAGLSAEAAEALDEFDSDSLALGIVLTPALRCSIFRWFQSVSLLVADGGGRAEKEGFNDKAKLGSSAYQSWLIPLLCIAEPSIELRVEKWKQVKGESIPMVERILAAPVFQSV